MDKDTVERPRNRLLSEAEEAWQYLGVSYWTLRGLRLAGKLPYVKFNRCLYYDVRDLDRFIETNKFQEDP
jgi:hypothetical protein